MLSILIALSRFSIDNEITAFKSLGISPYKFITPALTIGLVASILTASITFYFSPRAFGEVKKLTTRMLESGVTSTLREGAFTEIIDGITLYAKEIGKEKNHFYNVFIYDSRGKINNYIAYAKEGFINSESKNSFLTIYLKNGSIHFRSDDYESLKILNFKSYELKIPINIPHEIPGEFTSPKEMPTTYLIKYIRNGKGTQRDLVKASIQLGRRFSFPLAGIIFVFISIPIGFLSPREGKIWGFTFSIILFTLYYIILVGSENLAYRGIISGSIASMLPNILFLVAGSFMNRLLAKPG
jgi:lipopolysaccharide export system permease protein